MSQADKSSEYVTFLCNLKRTADFTGFGLQLHVVEVQAGQLLCVDAVHPGSPAERSGVKFGDIIIDANGVNAITSPPALTRSTITDAPYTLALLIKRKRSNKETLGYDQRSLASVRSRSKTRLSSGIFPRSGDERLKLLHLEKMDSKDYGFDIRQRIYNKGDTLETFVTQVDQWSPSHSSGLQVGDKIVRINDLSIERCKQDVIKSMVSQTGSLSVLIEDPDSKYCVCLFPYI